MEFLKNIFGGNGSGPKWGAILGAGLLAGIGGMAGGWIGGLVGIIAAVALGPVLNEGFFHVSKTLGLTSTPKHGAPLGSGAPLQDLDTPLKDKGGKPLRVPTPHNEQLLPPASGDIPSMFIQWEKSHQALLANNYQEYEKAGAHAAKQEAEISSFYTHMQQYLTQQKEHAAPGGTHEKLVQAVLTRAEQINPGLSEEGKRVLTSYVPALPSLNAATQQKHAALLGTTLPDSVTGMDPDNVYDFETIARGAFERSNGSGAQWGKLNPLQKSSVLFTELDRLRHKFDIKNPIAWDQFPGGSERRNDTPEAMYAWAKKGHDNATDNVQKIQFSRVMRYANHKKLRQEAEQYISQHAGPVIKDYTEFHKTQLVPASEQAQQFAGSLQLFNDSGIAVLHRGGIEGKEGVSTLTYFDSARPDEGVVTLIGQQRGGEFFITHRLQGDARDKATLASWESKATRVGDEHGVKADQRLFAELKAPGSQSLAEAMRQTLAAVEHPASTQVALGTGDGTLSRLAGAFRQSDTTHPMPVADIGKAPQQFAPGNSIAVKNPAKETEINA